MDENEIKIGIIKHIPPHMKAAVTRYVFDGESIGGFLRAVLENDLMNAFGRADEVNTDCMRGYCLFLYNYAPRDCYGSKEKVVAWQAAKGLKGKEAANAINL